MAFIKRGNQVIAFADWEDVTIRDQRLFEANEGLDEDTVETHLIRATERITARFRSSEWWRDYYIKQSGLPIRSLTQIPELQWDRIVGRKSDFTELCVYVALSDYIYPSIADFSSEDSAERQKIAYYKVRADELFVELIRAGDWYDFDGNGTVEPSEKQTGVYNLRRIR